MAKSRFGRIAASAVAIFAIWQAQPAAAQSTSTAIAKGAVSAVVNEATETSAQTIKEALGGDRQAQTRLHMGPGSQNSAPGRIINTKA